MAEDAKDGAKKSATAFTAVSPVDHDGVRYAPGDRIEVSALSREQAATLIEAGAITAL